MKLKNLPSCRRPARVILFLTLIMVLALISSATIPSLAATSFVIEQPLRFTLPQGNEILFFIYSSDVRISKTKVEVKEIRDPNGISLSGDNITPPGNIVVTQDGIRVKLKLNKDVFKLTGDYRIMLLISGKAKNRPVRTLATLTINRPPAEMNFDNLKYHTVELQRSYPGGEASGTHVLYLQETSGKTFVNDLQMDVQVGQIYVKDGKTLASGNVDVTPRFIKAKNASPNDELGQWALDVNISGIKSAGNFTTELRVNSPAFNGSKTIPLTMTVTDRWGFPLTVIVLGVLGGFLANYLSQTWRPRQVNKYKILQLRAMAQKYRPLVQDPEKVTKIQVALDSLSKAEDENNQGNTAAAATRLKMLEKDLGDFRREEIKQQTVLYDELIGTKAQVVQYSKALLNPTGQEKEKLSALLAELNSGQIDRLLEDDRIDEANRLLKTSQAQFVEFKKERLKRDLESLISQLEQIGAVPETLKEAKVEVEKKIEATKTLIRNGDIDRARENLNEINEDIKSLNRQLPPRARAAAPIIERNPLLSKVEENAAAQLTRIQILEPSHLRTAGSYLHFQIEDSEGVIQGDDLLRWDFSDSSRIIESSSRSITHAFTKVGRYHVKIDILRGPAKDVIKVLTLPLTILPGETEIELGEINSQIRRSEIFISAIALILAALTGLIYLYIGNAFGSLRDYLVAFLWGFGIDNSVRGFSAVLKKATGREG